MSIRERRQVEIQSLTERKAATVLAFLEQHERAQTCSAWPTFFAGIGRSGKHNLGARAEESLRAEFGSR